MRETTKHRRGIVLLSALLTAAMLQVSVASGAAASADRVYYGGNGYLLVETLFESWDDANATVEAMPTRGCADVHLATITSAGEQAVLGGLMAGSDRNAWLGGFQPPGEMTLTGGWEWVTGETWSFTNWAFGEPNDTPGLPPPTPGSEQYLEAYPGGEWNDVPAVDFAKYLVVEYEDCPAAATRPLRVMIVVDETIPTEIPGGGGPFVATGAAVDAGVMCDAGTTLNTALQARPARKHTNLKIEKLFTCDDGSGDFTVRMQVKLFPTGFTTAKWQITSGTDDYATLRGAGELVGTPGDPGKITDVYMGKVKR